MPTGYTQKIENGIEFNEFVLSCARAFGALISMRDEPSDAPIPEKFEPSDYHSKALVEAQKELKKYKTMSLERAEILSEGNYKKELKYYAKQNRKDAKLKKKYEAMLTKVKKWTPPTKDHEELKNFMIQQIESSINWDCHERKMPKKYSAKRWLSDAKKHAKRDVAYHTKGNEEEIKRCADRTNWVKSLVECLKTKKK